MQDQAAKEVIQNSADERGRSLLYIKENGPESERKAGKTEEKKSNKESRRNSANVGREEN